MIARTSSISLPTLLMAAPNFESSTCCWLVRQGGWRVR
jgi:hypothetical protein